jgi:hypothetical protein
MLAERIIRDEGYLPHPAKLRVMPDKGRRRVTGIVVNRPSTSRVSTTTA